MKAKSDTISEDAVIFLHIPKTAGSTLHSIIDRQYRPEQLFSIGLPGGNTNEELDQMDQVRAAQIRILRGHMPFGVHKYLPGPSTYTTILREPVDRLISYVFFVRRFPGHYLCDTVTSEELDLEEFIRNETHVMADNAQTRVISGVWQGPKFGACTEEMLETAKENLRERFAVVGLTERFDETVLLMSRAFGWRNLYYNRRNVTRGRPKRSGLAPATLKTVIEANQLDIELYHYAHRLFHDQVERLGPAFASELRRFQIANRWRGAFLGAYWQVRRISVRAFVRNLVSRFHSLTDRRDRSVEDQNRDAR